MSFRGFTLIEVLIVAFVLSVVTLAITGLSLVITRSSIESERATVAQGLLNEKLENLRAAYNELGYEVIAYTDESPLGLVDKEATVTRNNLAYLVNGHITYIDDPANGSLLEGTPVTETNADFAQVLYKATWTSNLGSQTSYLPHLISPAYAAPSSVVSSATFFNLKPVDKVCTAGTKTCPAERQCTPGAPSACTDEAGELTKTCPPSGVCSGEEFWVCPASGKCSEAVADSQPQQPAGPQPPSQSQCPNGVNTVGNTLEVCDLSACGDGQDNDGDGGIDVNGLPAPDPECEEGARNAVAGLGNYLYVPLTGCVVNSATCSLSDRGLQLWGRMGNVTSYSSCTAHASCGVVEKSWFACQTECSDGVNNDALEGADINDPDCHSDGIVQNFNSYTPRHDSEGSSKPECSNDEDDDNQEGADGADPSCDSASDDNESCPVDEANQCQTVHGCIHGEACGDCPNARSICLSGHCFECSKNNTEFCPAELCDLLPGGCDCRSGRCVQCTEINAKSLRCADTHFVDDPINRPYCASGRCVECLFDTDCGGDTPICRTAKPADPGRQNTCVNECFDGVDNDKDGKVDQVDETCEGQGTKEVFVCNDDDDNDNDGTIDFNGGKGKPADRGCISETDSDERQLWPQCSNAFDDDSDGVVDEEDSDCHTDGNAANPASYDPTDNFEGFPGAPDHDPLTQCNNERDDDNDQKIDEADPGCHADGDPTNKKSYDSHDRNETDQWIVPECDDTLDNDIDKKIDYRLDGTGDLDCTSADDPKEEKEEADKPKGGQGQVAASPSPSPSPTNRPPV